MNIYSKKQNIKLALLVIAILIGVATIWYSSNLVRKLSVQERSRIEIWAESVQEIQETPGTTLFKILESNTSIPVILTNGQDSILQYRNISERKIKNRKNYLEDVLQEMKAKHPPIVINLPENARNYVYYDDSVLLTNLFYYPYIQITVIALFMIVSYLAFSSSRKAEENQLWVGMSKETAHQLGTPISSLVAWIELMKMKNEDPKLIKEVEKDVKRLETITERFSKIGSEPSPVKQDINKILRNAVDYLKTRTSSRVIYELNLPDEEILIPLNVSLFEWVIENLCKNAIDAMNGKGKITINISERKDGINLDISDTGKGIPKSQQKTVFKPGYTTKKRGWGLGLSLAKRIIETYHDGKIFVKNSEIGKGTTFRIILNN